MGTRQFFYRSEHGFVRRLSKVQTMAGAWTQVFTATPPSIVARCINHWTGSSASWKGSFTGEQYSHPNHEQVLFAGETSFLGSRAGAMVNASGHYARRCCRTDLSSSPSHGWDFRQTSDETMFLSIKKIASFPKMYYKEERPDNITTIICIDLNCLFIGEKKTIWVAWITISKSCLISSF